ncbi:unnamed protein product [marine sediment metagenome]|uniref:GIY-YIG domain-containing protein n=1 Tax=marine sediment metagenome TaxID=412755 RepID=X1MBG8_9ZZZZ
MILESYGFTEVDEWHLSNGKTKPRLDKLDDKRAVYAFVVDNEVKYIGICDHPCTTLKDRMGTQRYNKSMPCLIKAVLEEKTVVKIFALVPEESEYKGLKVDLVRGLEYPLIKQLDPKWNDELKKYRRQK